MSNNNNNIYITLFSGCTNHHDALGSKTRFILFYFHYGYNLGLAVEEYCLVHEYRCARNYLMTGGLEVRSCLELW